MKFKPSIFNIEFEYNDKKYIYNTKSTTLALLEKSFNEAVKNENILTSLVECGFAVEEGCNEVEELERMVQNEINENDKSLELTIILTEACNFRCVYCYQKRDKKIFSKNDVDRLFKNLEVLFKDGLEELKIHYFGGEPLLNLEVLREIDKGIKSLCEKYNIKFSSFITTNGSLLTVEIINELQFTTIQLTFDGDINTHHKYKISDNYGYNDLLVLIDNIFKYTKSKLRIRFNICKENEKFFENVIDDVMSLKTICHKRFIFAFNPMRNYNNGNKFTELTAFEYGKIELRLKKYLISKGLILSMPKALLQPCKFVSGKALCLGPNLQSYFCTSSSIEIESNIKNYLHNSQKNYVFPEVCRSCKVLPMCINTCHVLVPGENACIAEKYNLVDQLKCYLNQPEMWKE